MSETATGDELLRELGVHGLSTEQQMVRLLARLVEQGDLAAGERAATKQIVHDMLARLTRISQEQLELLQEDRPVADLIAAVEALQTSVDGIAANVAILVQDSTPTPQAVTGRLTLEGGPMLTVDAAGVAKFQFEDDKGDVAAAPQGDGSGIAVSFASDNPSVVSGFGPTEVSQDANGYPAYTASPTVVADGTYNLSATVANTSGAPLVDDDGSTAFTQPSAVAVTLAAGQATTGQVSES